MTIHASTAPRVPVRTAAAATDLVKVYGSGETGVYALDGVTVGFAHAEFTAIMGPSGSGKSTLMHCLAGLDTPTQGSVRIGDTEISGLSDRDLTLLRRRRVGFVFQSFNLLPALTAEQNILLPLDLSGRRPDPARWDEVIGRLDLQDRLTHRPGQLSGGQQQRVACARALITRPDVIFADEPTGNLDSSSSAEVLDFLRSSVRELRQTVIMVTHDPVAASYADRVVFLADGRISGELYRPTPRSVLDYLREARLCGAPSWPACGTARPGCCCPRWRSRSASRSSPGPCCSTRR
jgi:putative ABC transport system ATP-binding protein